MVEAKKMMSPQAFLKELKQIKLAVKAEELTPEGKNELLEQVNEMEALVLELKGKLLGKNSVTK